MGSNQPSDQDTRATGSTESGNEKESQSNEAQALARSILNGLTEPTIVVDTEGQITNINSQALELYDTTEETAVGHVPNDLQGVGTNASNIVTEAIEQGADIQERQEFIIAGSGETPVERTVTLLYDDDGNFSGAMLIENDITEKRRQRNKK